MIADAPERALPSAPGRLATPGLPVLVTVAITTLYTIATTRLGAGPPQRAQFHWDGFWYAEIAQHGYRAFPGAGYKSAAFFPLLPALTHWASLALPGVALSEVALAVTLLSIMVAMLLVDALIGEWVWWQRAATIALLLALPCAFFYSVFYAESLFLLAEALTLLCLSRRELTWLTPLGVTLGTLARPLGVLLLVPVVLVVASRHDWSPRRRAVLVGASCAGVAILLVTYLVATGNPLAFLAARNQWPYFRSQGYLTALNRSVPRTVDLLTSSAALRPGSEPAIAAATWGLVAAVPLSLMALRWRRPFGWYALAMVGMIAAVGSIESQARMLLVVLPLWLAPIALYRHLRRTWILVGLLVPPGLTFNVYLAARFASGKWAG
ncbi:MAG: hypothetical protein M3010_05125 [Candidatus Dormibacteraeota bacterium]|nr:hypothetical protein [Candidatus Dormibacteraeota bacterium]